MITLIALSLLLGISPATQSSDRIRVWLDQLSDRDAQVRDQAKENLMGLRAEDLPTLKKSVQAAQPLRPSQKTVLRDIVTQVYFSGIAYPPSPTGNPFLGLLWSGNPDSAGGLVVSRRVPGFSAYRMLRDGDVITGIEQLPADHFDDPTAFGSAIRNTFRPGQTVVLRVERNGNPIHVPVLLRPQPAGVENSIRMEMWINLHEAEADKYWNENFAPLVGDDVS
jgi:hypothetical protein